jgi:hypothetical protein
LIGGWVGPRAVLDAVVKREIELNLKEKAYVDVDWINLSQARVQYQARMNIVIELSLQHTHELQFHNF